MYLHEIGYVRTDFACIKNIMNNILKVVLIFQRAVVQLMEKVRSEGHKKQRSEGCKE